jgi:glycosyltransferase involved in cell wall biosynthesis
MTWSETPRPQLSIVIPARNEAAMIARILEELRSLSLEDYEIIVVDDGSDDGTGDIAEAQGARVVRHPYNVGNGAAVKTGLRHARGQWVVLMDADGQHRPADVPALLRELEQHHMVVGARDAAGQAGWHRLAANTAYNWFATYITEFPVVDLTSGFRAVRRADALRFIDLLPNTFSYPATLTLAFLRSGLTLKYVPVRMPPRVGQSKLRIWKDGTQFLLIITRIATLFSPARVFVPVSGFFLVAGLATYLYRYLTEGRFTNMAAFLVSTAVIIFMMGLVSEQIASLRMERLSGANPADEET